jgi:putative hemin transport protein
MTKAISISSPWEIAQAWKRLRAVHPGLRARDAARKLGLSEAELVASGCGDIAIHLNGHFTEIVRALTSLGEVMALTRNEHAVHEKTGRYENLQIEGARGLVLGPEIDLRLFLSHWHYGFAVQETTGTGIRQSLQFFDADGTAVHKVYLTEASDEAAFETLIAHQRSADQSPFLAVQTRAPVHKLPDQQMDKTILRAAWSALRDTHEFHGMLKLLSITRLQALRLVGRERATPVAAMSLRFLMECVRDAALPIMVFVASPGVVQIHTGKIENLKATGPWFNVLDERFNLHIRQAAIASAWVVRKPTTDGVVTSLELFDAAGRLILQVFGKRKPGQPECRSWRTLVEALCSDTFSSIFETTQPN